jgi:RNA polymerase sigma-70 factor (ECF subfamily)
LPDADGFDAFYRSTQQRLFSYLYAITGDAAEAQDVVHEAYARAWQRWATVREYADPEAWMRTVARRIAVSGWRRARTRLAAHRRHGVPDPSPGPSPDTVALVTALRAVNADQRLAIVLHHLVGLPVADVARETGVPVGTVKARLARGRRALSELLAIDLPEDSHV